MARRACKSRDGDDVGLALMLYLCRMVADIMFRRVAGKDQQQQQQQQAAADDDSEWVPVAIKIWRLKREPHTLISTSRPLPHGLKYLKHLS